LMRHGLKLRPTLPRKINVNIYPQSLTVQHLKKLLRKALKTAPQKCPREGRDAPFCFGEKWANELGILGYDHDTRVQIGDTKGKRQN
jgi:hypothetical protein